MSIVSRIQELILSDDTDDSERLVNDYQEASAIEKAAIDNAFISLCGYSLATLIKESGNDIAA